MSDGDEFVCHGFTGTRLKSFYTNEILGWYDQDVELAIRINVEEMPEGLYLATSEELPGLVAQGRTVAEVLEIARDVARKLIEARREREDPLSFATASDRHEYTIVVAA